MNLFLKDDCGVAEQAAEKVDQTVKSEPQGLKPHSF
jgi:hypothetical protein